MATAELHWSKAELATISSAASAPGNSMPDSKVYAAEAEGSTYWQKAND